MHLKTIGPEDHRTHLRTIGPEDHRTHLKTIGPEDHRTHLTLRHSSLLASTVLDVCATTSVSSKSKISASCGARGRHWWWWWWWCGPGQMKSGMQEGALCALHKIRACTADGHQAWHLAFHTVNSLYSVPSELQAIRQAALAYTCTQVTRPCACIHLYTSDQAMRSATTPSWKQALYLERGKDHMPCPQ